MDDSEVNMKVYIYISVIPVRNINDFLSDFFQLFILSALNIVYFRIHTRMFFMIL